MMNRLPRLFWPQPRWLLCLLPFWGIGLLISLSGCLETYTVVETPDTRQPLTMGISPWLGYAPLYLARELGFLEGQAIELIEYPLGDAQRLKDLQQQKIVAETSNIEDILDLAQQPESPFAILLVTSISRGADTLLVRPHITSVAQLRGKRVAIAKEGYLNLYLLARALERNAMSLRDIVPVEMTATQQEEAYFADQVDAVVVFDPARTRLLRSGAREIFSSRELPDEIIDVLVVNRHYVRNNPANVRNLLRIWFKSLEFLRTQPMEAAQRLAPVFKMRQSDVLNGVALLKFPSPEENYDLMQDDSPELLIAIDLFQELLLERNRLTTPVNTQHLLISEAELTQGLPADPAASSQGTP